MKEKFSLKLKQTKIFPLTSKNEQMSQSYIILSQVAFHLSLVTYTSEIQTINS